MKSTKVLSLLIIMHVACQLQTVSEQPSDSLTILDNMAIRGASYDSIETGISDKDYERIRKASLVIVELSSISEIERNKLALIIGKNEIPSFIHFDQMVILHADSIRLAAEREDLPEIRFHFNVLDKKACGGCHDNYWKKVDDWKKNR
ncbi:MAG TPA: hypothetical protein EYO08_04530 [Candidatus Marinimicrobia bacterium]|nr:hypothetical protein [Candidatus Neomarinimicrobiota bacterium]HIB58864.1 hypothetical protein [Candidatus Neomarinimicrobiota bacterium]